MRNNNNNLINNNHNKNNYSHLFINNKTIVEDNCNLIPSKRKL